MTFEKMQELLSKDEKITIEYKECVNQIHDSVYETVSAFSNRYGGYIIMETPNPMSLAIYTHAFYMDPSHNKPIHPLTMEYFMRKVGFKEVEILFTESSKYPADIPKLVGDHIENLEAFNQSMEEVSRTLFGSQDYAIIGRK